MELSIRHTTKSIVSCPIPVPPIRAKIVREWSYFMAGKAYNVSCQVQGSHPSAYTKAWIGEKELKKADYEVSA